MDLWWVRFLTFQSSPSTDPLQACLEGVGRACEAWTWTSWPDIHQPLICAVLPIVLMGQWWQNILLCITTGVQLLWTEVLQLWNMIDWVREQRPSTEENCVGNWKSKQPVTSSSSGRGGCGLFFTSNGCWLTTTGCRLGPVIGGALAIIVVVVVFQEIKLPQPPMLMHSMKTTIFWR